MSRLTERYDDGSYGLVVNDNSMEKKLGILEDIEEEMGIDLVTLIGLYDRMAKGKYVYYRLDDGEVDYESLYDRQVVICPDEREFQTYHYEMSGRYSFDGYGRTWALTREELE